MQCLCVNSGLCGNVVVGTGLIGVYSKWGDELCRTSPAALSGMSLHRRPPHCSKPLAKIHSGHQSFINLVRFAVACSLISTIVPDDQSEIIFRFQNYLRINYIVESRGVFTDKAKAAAHLKVAGGLCASDAEGRALEW